jgi:hypothetical protein
VPGAGGQPRITGIESEALLILVDQEGICGSSGSACLADSDEPSHVVKAMKPESAASRQMIRFSLGLENTGDDVDRFFDHLKTWMAAHPPTGPVVHNAEELRQFIAEKERQRAAQPAVALNEDPPKPGETQ